jgi:hypothetical protein
MTQLYVRNNFITQVIGETVDKNERKFIEASKARLGEKFFGVTQKQIVWAD